MKPQDELELEEPLLSGHLDEHIESTQDNKKGKRYLKSEMSTLHRVLLSPWEKWRDHGRFPWKLLCHVLLMLCSSTQVSQWIPPIHMLLP